MKPQMHAKMMGLVAAAGLFLAGSAAAQQGTTLGDPATTQADPKAGGVNSIWAYAGTWTTRMEHFDTPYSKAGKESAELVNNCWKSGVYVACRQIVNGDPKILLVFTCSDEHTCTSYQIPPNGGDPGSGKLLLDGATWTFPWTQTENGKTTYFRVVNVWSSPTTIDMRQEFSTDQQHWTRMATGHEEKQPPGSRP